MHRIKAFGLELIEQTEFLILDEFMTENKDKFTV